MPNAHESHLNSQINEKVGIPLMIREATEMDFQDIMSVERDAFGEDDEANLVAKLLDDQTAKPTLSLRARSTRVDFR